MISFTLCILILVAGYFTYGKFIEKLFSPQNISTPATKNPDGVDNVVLPGWKIFMIQFLNIAGLGPIFGAILGAKFGEASFLWITLGCIFAGATHDYVSGMISLRNGGESLAAIVGRYLGRHAKFIMRITTVLLLMLVGVSFVSGPAGLLEKLTPDTLDSTFWTIVIFAYYVMATLLPIDKIIGKIYPLFAIAMIVMALGIMGYLIINWVPLPEIWDGIGNTHPEKENLPIFPIMFVSISCGAISGFHATQSPMMARCMKSEFQGRPIFYGAMIVEGIITLIWAAAATYFFHTNPEALFQDKAAVIVFDITNGWLGSIGYLLTIFGVIAAPITSGDTAFRSARLIISEFTKLNQSKIWGRLFICIPMFAIAVGMLIMSYSKGNGFNVIWRYTLSVNQILACFTLWAITIYFLRKHKPYIYTLVPALFMTAVCSCYVCIAPECLHLGHELSYAIGALVTTIIAIAFFRTQREYAKHCISRK